MFVCFSNYTVLIILLHVLPETAVVMLTNCYVMCGRSLVCEFYTCKLSNNDLCLATKAKIAKHEMKFTDSHKCIILLCILFISCKL